MKSVLQALLLQIAGWTIAQLDRGIGMPKTYPFVFILGL